MRKTVLITGSSSGFGKETAKLFQKKGWNVIATMPFPEQEYELTQLDRVFVTALDVLDINSIEKAVKAGVAKFGNIDVLINNAGYGLMGVFESASREQIQKQYAVNVFGLMDVTRTVLPYLRANGSGTIINISSFRGLVALPFGSLYNSTKFAIEGFSETLSHELAPFNILVKIIEPGGVATNFRNAQEMIKNKIPEYDPIMVSFFERYSKTTQFLLKAAAADVAKVIYKASTDGKIQLRYVVGADAQFYIDCKKKNSEEVFVRLMRDYFV
ncbi:MULTISPECIES: SDR family oxidoreductase [unclassified Sphingobacterium]|uniref:SDR family oxidoreductase n=1 Tax=unclassified Sphingobacterium TaxID=2609468 RepID=UPI001047F9FD|nr:MULTISPECIES: SDR family oxidoreductase [unclassified Sphingobacterium]MCS3556165.1 NAD(P)-dependent dehydrogenase (short-subunit alcohol dehydrogenase family) [Sphingobacterium sp. JUb21]TCR08541.1 short-subunit dehydrogenase [Sphingobacterium sp. JUb20]